MNIIEIIYKKRNGLRLTAKEISYVIEQYTSENLPDYQVSALLMAIYFQGLDENELLSLTNSMLNSGRILDLSLLPGQKIDKHSTGGVGDKISLPLAAAAAACGVVVPMISGRGLGITGGTLDKLESIPGFRTNLNVEEFFTTLSTIGLSLIGQTSDLAPADKKLYALRDVTGTVESIPLISSSIMSKKLAEGIDGLVLDVKVGSGAFMKTLPEARRLAETLRSIGVGAGKKVTAFITDMDQPLGQWIGNAAEVNESLEIMRGRGPADVRELTCVLGGEMMRLAGLVNTEEEGRVQIERALSDGRALAKFAECAKLQGATIDLSSVEALPLHLNTHQIIASSGGYMSRMNTNAIGLAGVTIGVGRSRKEDTVDPKAYLYVPKKRGEHVQVGEVLCEFAVHEALSNDKVQAAKELLQSAFIVDKTCPDKFPLILEVLR